MATVRFEREVRAVARLNHGNVVQVYDFGTEGELAYIVMEFIQGRELKDYFDAKERLDLKTIFRMMTELLDALHFAHEAGIIHRDVKPANIMIDAGGHAKLTDFGVARFTEPQGDQIEATRVGTIIGTPSYMSPEQIQGQPIDRRSDIFSAGIIFYQLLTWQKPFQGTQWELAKKIIEDDPPWPSKLVDIPADIDRVVARAMAKQRERPLRDGAQVRRSDPAHRAGQAAGRPRRRVHQAAGGRGRQGRRAHGSRARVLERGAGERDPDDLALYVEQFPHGAFVVIAQKRIAKLREKKS